MAILKGNSVTDKDIENLFDNNNAEGFSENSQKNEEDESVIPPELDIQSDKTSAIRRPTWDTETKKAKWSTDQFRADVIEKRKREQELKNQTDEQLLSLDGSVSKKVFNKVAELKKKAQLDEFVSNQRKLPVINNNTVKYKLYNNQSICNYHIFKPIYMINDNVMLCSCKFCSLEKTFTMEDWKIYELENRSYL